MRWCGCQPCVPLDIKYDAARDRVQLPACQVHAFTRPQQSGLVLLEWGLLRQAQPMRPASLRNCSKWCLPFSSFSLQCNYQQSTFTNIFKKQRIQRGLQLLYECQSLHCILPCNAGYKPVPSQVYPSQFLFFPQFGNTLHNHAGPSDLASLS